MGVSTVNDNQSDYEIHTSIVSEDHNIQSQKQ